MSQVRLRLGGFDELRAQFRALTPALKAEGGTIVVTRATRAADHIRDAYHEKTGNLKRGVKVTTSHTPGGTIATVKSSAKHAFIYENGTQARHTDIGANRGAMPPAHVFVPTVIRERRAMLQDLIALVERQGLRVTGGHE